MATQAELERQARTGTSQKTFAQDVRDRIAAGKSESEAFREAASGREQTIDPKTGAPLFGKARKQSGLPRIRDVGKTPEEIALRDQQEAQKRLLEAQRRGNIEALRAAETTALGATGRQRERAVEEAFGQRRGIKTEAEQAGRSLAQYLASRGLGRSGAAVGGQIAQAVTRQEGLTQARGQEASRLADIGQREADIRTQTAAGIAQAGQQAEAQRAQLEIARLQQQQTRALQLEDIEATRTFEVQQQAQADLIAQQQREADLAIEEARRTQDFEREDELLRLKADLDQEAIRLRAQLTPARGGAGGLTFTQERTVFNDQVRSGLAGVEAALGGLPEGTPIAQQDTAVINQLRNLVSQGTDATVINEIARQAGLTSPEDQRRIFTTPAGIVGGGVQMPTARDIFQAGLR